MLEVLLLGPIEVYKDGENLRLAPLERNLCALLALSVGKVLSTDRIIDRLWGERPPAAPRSRVQGLVSSLRRKLGTAVETRHPGYVLKLPESSCDVNRLEKLTREARDARTSAESAPILREASKLWRGDPLDGGTAPGLEGARTRLSELRVSQFEELCDVELRLGRHREIVDSLIEATSLFPVRERLHGQLMVALCRSSRRADALQSYVSLRYRLADRYGSDPCADLQELHAKILRDEQLPPPCETDNAPKATEADSWAVSRPAQLPARPSSFVGRTRECAQLTAAIASPNREPKLLVISGAGGLGKTALAVAWAHDVAERFRDGQIFVDLGGSGTQEPLSRSAAVRTVLFSLGVDSKNIPSDPHELICLYRTVMCQREVLIVADDADSAAQVLALAPPTSKSQIVATCRKQLPSLAVQHSTSTLTLEPLDTEASLALLESGLGSRRLAHGGANELAVLCGGWPLMLRIVTAALATRPHQTLWSFMDEVGARVEQLSVDDDQRTVAAALDAAISDLDPAVARLFSQLGLLPGATVSLQLVAATAGISLVRARQLLDALTAANLVVETAQDRYWVHELVDRYARRRAETLPDREAVERRILRWYLMVFDAVSRSMDALSPQPLIVEQPEWLPLGARGDGAEAFMAAEEANIGAILEWTHDRGDYEVGRRLLTLADSCGIRLTESACELGLQCAVQLHDWHAVGEARARLGIVLMREQVRLADAAEHLMRATVLLDPGESRLLGLTRFALGYLRRQQGSGTDLNKEIEQALQDLEPGREPMSYSLALLAHAEVCVAANRGDLARERYAQAMILCEATIGKGSRTFAISMQGASAMTSAKIAAAREEVAGFLTNPRVQVLDRTMARNMIDIGAVAGPVAALEPTVMPARIPSQRRGDTVFRAMWSTVLESEAKRSLPATLSMPIA